MLLFHTNCSTGINLPNFPEIHERVIRLKPPPLKGALGQGPPGGGGLGKECFGVGVSLAVEGQRAERLGSVRARRAIEGPRAIRV